MQYLIAIETQAHNTIREVCHCKVDDENGDIFPLFLQVVVLVLHCPGDGEDGQEVAQGTKCSNKQAPGKGDYMLNLIKIINLNNKHSNIWLIYL